MTEYKVSVHYDEGTVLHIEADTPEQAQEKLRKYYWMKLVFLTQVITHLT